MTTHAAAHLASQILLALVGSVVGYVVTVFMIVGTMDSGPDWFTNVMMVINILCRVVFILGLLAVCVFMVLIMVGFIH